MARVRKQYDIRSNALDKQAEKEKRSKIYTTEIIDAIIKDKTGKQDLNPFWHGLLNYRDAGVTFEYTEWEKHELEKCSEDCLYFVLHYAKFKNDKGHTLVKLRDYQIRLLNLMGAERYDDISETVIPMHQKLILMLSRQTGKTTTTAAYFVWALIFHNDKTAFVSANKGSTGTEIISKIKDVLEGLPFFMKPGILNLSEKRIKFENGSSLKTAAASKSPATGDSILLLYIDEVALIAPHIIDEYWASVQPTMSNFRGAQVIMSSTPRGKGNLFYNIYTKAIPWDSPEANDEKNYKKFIRTRVDWWEVPGRDAAWEQEQRDDLGDEKFNREFGLSFESSSTRLINAWTINFMNKIKKKFVSRALYNIPNDICEKILWHPDFDPTTLTLYDLLYSRFLFVIDLALGIEAGVAGKEDSDYNIIHIYKMELMSPRKIEENRDWLHPIDIRNVVQYKEIGIYADNFKDEESCAEAAKYLAFNIFKTGYSDGVNNIDNVRILFEMNFNGKNWYNKFSSHPGFYDLVIIKTPNGTDSNGNVKLMNGFRTKTGSKGKKYYCDLGEKMLRQRLIIVSQYHSDINLSTIYQLENFGKDKKGNYNGAACHDDLSVTVFFVSIAGEQEYFRIWLEEWLENMILTPKVQIIRQMLEMYVEQEPEISDLEFTNFYNIASLGFGKITRLSNTYGQMMNNSGMPRYSPYQSSPYLSLRLSYPLQNRVAMTRYLK